MQIQRKSCFDIGRTYFFTGTIQQWLPLLSSNENKELIVNYLKELSGRSFIKSVFLCRYAQSCSFHLAAASEKWKGDTPGKFFKVYST